jgi:hypothetical protein
MLENKMGEQIVRLSVLVSVEKASTAQIVENNLSEMKDLEDF